ncbi:MAG: hypothetical protein NVS3B20_00990 [Polyangiales bacterium]
MVALACRNNHDGVDPDGVNHDPPSAHDVAEKLREVSLKDVVGAVAGVSVHDAPAVLESWLRASGAAGLEALSMWPTRQDGGIDLDRAPVSAIEVEGELSPGKRSNCGQVVVVFAGNHGPAMRFKLKVPSTSQACRGTDHIVRLHDLSAMAALREAIAAGRVTVDAPQPVASADVGRGR